MILPHSDATALSDIYSMTQKTFTSKRKKGDLGLVKHFSKKYGSKG